MATKKEEMQQVPGNSRGVRTTTGLRMLKMCRPICPNSKIEMEQDTMGNWRRVEKGPDSMNCQLEGGRWWKLCEERGHDPYWTVTVWYTKRDITAPILDENGEETGELEVTKTARVPHTVRRPNLAQVAIARNINNGRGPQDAIERKGFRYLGSLGFDECCQFRNCQKVVKEKFVIDGLGRYCSQLHMALVAQTHGQDLGAAPHRLVQAGFHKQGTQKQSLLKRQEAAAAIVVAESLDDEGTDL